MFYLFRKAGNDPIIVFSPKGFLKAPAILKANRKEGYIYWAQSKNPSDLDKIAGKIGIPICIIHKDRSKLLEAMGLPKNF